MKDFIRHIFTTPLIVCAAIFLFSGASLMAALIAQHIYGLEPCILCLYQRIPFAVTMFLGLLGIFLLYRPEGQKFAAALIGLCGIGYGAGGVLALHHHGVEQKWWRSFFEECAAAFDPTSTEDLLSLIESAPVVRCDEIPWEDPLLGLSMAAWNAIISPLVAILCFVSCVVILKRLSAEKKQTAAND